MIARRAAAPTPRPPSRGACSIDGASVAERGIEFVGRVKGCVATTLVITLGSAAAADVQAAARLSVAAWSEFCVKPRLAGKQLNPPLRRVEESSRRKGNVVREWWTGNGTILADRETSGGLRGCSITMSGGQRATVGTLRIVERNFEIMMAQRAQFGLVMPCNTLGEYFALYESKQPNLRGYYIKAFLNTNDALGFLLLVAAESGTEPHSCPQKEAS